MGGEIAVLLELYSRPMLLEASQKSTKIPSQRQSMSLNFSSRTVTIEIFKSFRNFSAIVVRDPLFQEGSLHG